ncbi:MAG: nitroreductase family protein [Thermoleophilia bacterium]|nr:nitroreductase family protein [Thermoleophilia bacterium]
MEAIEAILQRRSIREYTDQSVSDEMVTQLLRAAMAAPSAGNQQPWEFIVVKDRAMLAAVAECSHYAGMVREAQVAVVVCADLDREQHKGFWVQDCSAAIENLLVAAEALGLGAVWVGAYPVEDRVAALRATLHLPERVIPMSIVSIGHPAGHPGPAERFDPARIHLERWQEKA